MKHMTSILTFFKKKTKVQKKVMPTITTRETEVQTPKTIKLVDSIITTLIPAYKKRGERIVALEAQVSGLAAKIVILEAEIADYVKAVDDVGAATDAAIAAVIDVGGSLGGIVE